MATDTVPSPANPPVSRQVHLGLIVVWILALFVQFYFAGRGAFGASNYETHKDLGGILHIVSLLILLASVAMPATRNRVDIGMAAALFVLVTIQVAIGDAKHPNVGAFHPVNALLVVGLSFGILRRDRTQLAAGL
ncbi:MAG: DUF6220 domain-containing protein [Actinobacteria bacterium]|nr:DUF6220 domain-containing protein [Actinomycetota bacterium]